MNVAPMPNPPDLSLILPLYREAEHIQESLAEIHRVLMLSTFSSEVILYDDASPDDTVAIVEQELPKYPEMRLIRHERNQGRGATVRDGFRLAQGTMVGFIDVDLEVSPVYIPRFVAMILDGDVEVVTGLRVYRTSPRAVTRFFANTTYRFLVRSLLGLPYEDTETGYKFFRRETILPILEETRDPGWFWDTEIMAACFRHRLRVKEVPVLFFRRYDKTSTVKVVRDSIEYFRKLLAFRRTWRRS